MTIEPTSADAEASPYIAASAAAAASSDLSPRTRWAAVIWGLFFAAVAWTGIWMLSDVERREGITDWIAGFTPGTITVMVVLSVGVLLLIAGLVGLVRHGQRGFSERTTAAEA